VSDLILQIPITITDLERGHYEVGGGHRITDLAQPTPLATGTVLKAETEDRFLLLGIYSPNRVPHRGADTYVDLISPRVLERAAWNFARKSAKVILGHGTKERTAELVENTIWRAPPWTIDLGNGQKEVVREGDWLGGFILGDEAWKAYLDGKIGGASFEAWSDRDAPTPETIARVRSFS